MKKVLFSVLLFCLTLFSLFSIEPAVQYACRTNYAKVNSIQAGFKIENRGAGDIFLNDLTLRYFYTKEGTVEENLYVDYAAIGSGNITHTFKDSYLELGFTDGAGILTAGNSTGEILVRFNKEDWSAYDQADDYSFNPAGSDYADTDKILLYYNGQKVWGVEAGSHFPTPCPCDVSMLRMEPAILTVEEGEQGVQSFMLDLKDETIAAFDMVFTYDPEVVSILSIESGENGFANIAFNLDQPGVIKVAGFDTSYIGPGNELDFLRFTWKGLKAGETQVEADLVQFYTPSYDDVAFGFTDSYIKVTGNLCIPTPLPTPIPSFGPESGTFFILEEPAPLVHGLEFSTIVAVNTGNEVVGAFDFSIKYDPLYVAPAPEVTSIARGFTVFSNPGGAGLLRIVGINPFGKGLAPVLELVKIEWTVLKPGHTDFRVEPVNLTKPSAEEFENIRGTIFPVVIDEAPAELAGAVSLVPDNISVRIGDTFNTAVTIDSGDYILGAYGSKLSYDKSMVKILSSPLPGADCGSNYFINDQEAGTLYFSGFDVLGIGPGRELDVLMISWEAIAAGTTEIGMKAVTLASPTFQNVGIPRGYGAVISISE